MTVQRRASAVIVAGVIVGLVSGAALGVLWAALAPRVPVVVGESGVVPDDFQPEQYFASDVAFGLLGLVAGVAIAIGLAYMRREHLFSVLVAAMLAGGLGTAAMWFVGTRLGSVDIEGLRATITQETVVDGPLEVSLGAMFVMWPLASAIVITFLALGDWLTSLRSTGR